jgi:glyoxylase I family protein
VEVLALDHIDLTAVDLERSTGFYELVLGALGFSRVEHPSYVAWSNGRMNLGLRAAAEAERHIAFDRNRAGLHHIALRAAARADVDEFHAFLVAHRLSVLDSPAEYPEYGPDYYAVYFADPDGIKLELVHFPWGYWRGVQRDGSDDGPRYSPK